MSKKNLKKGAWAAAGVAVLAVTSALCVKGMKAVDQRLKDKKAAAEMEMDEAELFADLVEEAEPAAEEAAEETL